MGMRPVMRKSRCGPDDCFGVISGHDTIFEPASRGLLTTVAPRGLLLGHAANPKRKHWEPSHKSAPLRVRGASSRVTLPAPEAPPWLLRATQDIHRLELRFQPTTIEADT